jgi:hypothetical protein
MEENSYDFMLISHTQVGGGAHFNLLLLVVVVQGDYWGAGSNGRLYYRKSLYPGESWTMWNTPPGSPEYLISVVNTKDGQIFSVAGDSTIWWRQVATEPWRFYTSEKKMKAVGMRKDGLTLLGVGLDNMMYTLNKGSKTWDLAPGRACCIVSVAEADDGSFFSVGSDDRWLWRWPYFGAPAWEVWDASLQLRTLTISPDGKILGIDINGRLQVRGQAKSNTWMYLVPAVVTTLAPRYTVSRLAQHMTYCTSHLPCPQHPHESL